MGIQREQMKYKQRIIRKNKLSIVLRLTTTPGLSALNNTSMIGRHYDLDIKIVHGGHC